MRNLLIAIGVALLSLGCGDDSVVERPDAEESPGTEITEPETATGRVIETETDASNDVSPPGQESKPESNEPAPSRSVEPSAPGGAPPPTSSETERPTEPSLLAGGYDLETVDGEGLPAVTDTRPGCRIEVLSGDLSITAASRFTLSTGTREICDGRVTAEDVWEASGTVRLDGTDIHFSGQSGDAFGAAEGSFAGGSIRITSISAEGGEEKVDWTFGRR